MREFGLAVAGAVAFFSFSVAAAEADTITLKNGTKVEGKVTQRRPDFIVVDRGGPSVFYRTEEVKQIEWSDPGSELKQRHSLPEGDTELLLNSGKPRAEKKAPAAPQKQEKSALAPSGKK